LVVIAWVYVVLMMSVAEAMNSNGTVLGAIVTFFLYGLLPLTVVVYVMRSPQRRKAAKAREAAELQASIAAGAAYAAEQPSNADPSSPPDASRHAPAAAESSRVTPVRKEP
jgi:predicted MFS family arabinose efflux permease